MRQLWGLADMRAHYLIDTEDWRDSLAFWDIDPATLGEDGRAYWASVTAYAAIKRGDRAVAESALKVLSAFNAADSEETPNDIMELEIKALSRLAEGARDEAVTLMREATKRADALPVDFGPPSIAKPPHELFGEILLELGRAREAQSEFRKSLELAPKRARSLLGLARASAAAGESRSAREASAELRAIWRGADSAQLALLK
jgi:tetratricopeptide (TPR) repeat protein